MLGDWLLARPGGIRGFRYDSAFPDDFGQLGTGRYTKVHNIGEIWCATLAEVSRRMDRGLAIQLVVDALKLTPANPSMLVARDAILLALQHQRAAGRISASSHAVAQQASWNVFARFGMGPRARSNGAQLTGIVADYDLPWEPPAVLAWAHDRVDIVGDGLDAALWHKWWDGYRWGGWESLAASCAASRPPSSGASTGSTCSRWAPTTRWGTAGGMAAGGAAGSRSAGS